MKQVFADTFFWIALLNPRDSSHAKTLSMGKNLAGARLITTDEVLNEFLAHFSKSGPESRQRAVASIENIFTSDTIQVVTQSHKSFQAGFDLYKARPDKSYSLTDCTSMTVMKKFGIMDVLTNDAHFEQEGFNAMFRAK